MFDEKGYHKKYHDRPGYKEQNKKYARTYRQSGKANKKRFEYCNRNALWVTNYKAEQGCLFCREDCPACLLFHHENDKEAEVSRLVARGRALKIVQQEVERCVVLCANCHNKVHAGLICFG